MAVEVVAEGLACEDCCSIIANNDDSGITDPVSHWAAITHIDLSRGGRLNVVMACGEGCEGQFSSQPCDYCGCGLDGKRHPIAVLANGVHNGHVGKGI